MARCTRATPSNAFAFVIKSLFRGRNVLLFVAAPLESRRMANADLTSDQVLSLRDSSLVAGAPLPPVTLVLRPAEANVLCNRGCAYTLAGASEVHGSFR